MLSPKTNNKTTTQIEAELTDFTSALSSVARDYLRLNLRTRTGEGKRKPLGGLFSNELNERV